MKFLTISKNKTNLVNLLGFKSYPYLSCNIFVDLKPTSKHDAQKGLDNLVKIINQYMDSSIKPKQIKKFKTNIVKVVCTEFTVRILSTKYKDWLEVKKENTLAKDIKTKIFYGEINALCSIDGLEKAYKQDNINFIKSCESLIRQASSNITAIEQ